MSSWFGGGKKKEEQPAIDPEEQGAGVASEKSFDPDDCGRSIASEKSFDPDSAGFVGDASLSEKSYDPETAGFLRNEQSGSDGEKSFDASEDSFDPDNVDNDDAASAASFDPERADSRGLASEKSFDPDREEGEDEQDLSGFEEQEKKVATISADVAQRAMANMHEHAKTELSKMQGRVEELTRANALLKGALQDSEDTKKKLKESFEKMVVEGRQREESLKAQLADATGSLTASGASIASLQTELAAQLQELAGAHAHTKELEGKLSDTGQRLERESAQLAAEKERAAKASEQASKHAEQLKAQAAELSQSNSTLEAELKGLRQSLASEGAEKGKVSAARQALEQDLAASQQQCENLRKTIEQWATWRTDVGKQVRKLKDAQSELITAVLEELKASYTSS